MVYTSCYYTAVLWYSAAKYNDNKNRLIRNRQQVNQQKTLFMCSAKLIYTFTCIGFNWIAHVLTCLCPSPAGHIKLGLIVWTSSLSSLHY